MNPLPATSERMGESCVAPLNAVKCAAAPQWRDVVVIGGGFAGAALARRLQRRLPAG